MYDVPDDKLHEDYHPARICNGLARLADESQRLGLPHFEQHRVPRKGLPSLWLARVPEGEVALLHPEGDEVMKRLGWLWLPCQSAWVYDVPGGSDYE